MDTSASEKHPNILARAFTSIILYRNYRLLWMGSWSEHMGDWMEATALLWLLNEMTNSPLLGTLSVTLRHIPTVFFAFIGGVVADRINRRLLLIYTLAVSAGFSIVMAVLVHTALIQPWHILVYSALAGVHNSFNHPARNTLLPNLVKREHYLNAITLDNASVTASRIIGAPLAGFIVGFAGTTPVLGLKAVGAILAIFWLSWIRAPSMLTQAKKKTPFRSFAEGMRYVGEHKAVLTQILLYLLPYFVTNSYTGLLPYFATNTLHVGPGLYGIMNAAPGAGALMSSFVLASLVSLRRKGLFLLLGGIAQGAGLILFASSPIYLSSVLLLVFIGGANTTFMTLNNTIIQELVSDQVRGRVMSFREVTSGLGPAGSLISGAAAGIVGVPLALGAAGCLSIMVLLGILITVPQTRQRG